MSRLLFAVTAASLLCAPTSVLGKSWALGSHLGVSAIHSGVQGAGSSSSIGWPSSVLTYQPGARLAVGDSSHRKQMFLDFGLLYLNEGGSGFSSLLGLLGYQRCFAARGRVAPFLNAAIGLYREGGPDHASTAGVVGAGLGIRKALGGEHGALRGEIRSDLLFRDTRTGRPALMIIGLRLGFDLWGHHAR